MQRLGDWSRGAMNSLAGALLEQSCALCHLPSGDTPLCAGCAAELPQLPDAHCPQCALPLTGGLLDCPDCARHQPAFDHATAVWSYGFPVDTLIRDFKYGHHLYLGGFFGAQLATALEQAWAATPNASRPDLIVPMPLHPNRLKTRGFNQAAEIARHVAQRTGIACAFDALTRLHDTPAQAGLHRDERWRNLLGAFACPQPLAAKHILLIDDVLTTGASLSACATALRHAGAQRVDVAILARTPEPSAAGLTA